MLMQSCLSPGVWDQPGQYKQDCIYKNNKEINSEEATVKTGLDI